MNITSIHGYNPNLTQGSLTNFKDSQNYLEKTNVEKCEKNNKRGYDIAFSGSLQSKSMAAATAMGGSIGDKILSSKKFGSFLEYSQNHNIATSALIALGLAGVLRPATILALPGKKDKEDKTYAAGHSFASALVGFVASLILTSPLDEAVKKLYDAKDEGFFGSKILKNLQQEIKEKEAIKDTLDDAGKKALNSLYQKKAALKTLIKNIPDWAIAIPRAIITIALIPPILKYVFGVEKKKKIQKVETANQIQQENKNVENKEVSKVIPPFDFNNSSGFKDFGFAKGGLN